ncbi:hypothetical protein IAU60_006874 [Kwoniella sp. DSM 27419]
MFDILKGTLKAKLKAKGKALIRRGKKWTVVDVEDEAEQEEPKNTIQIDHFDRLEPVHDRIMDELFHLDPSAVVPLSKFHHRHYIPKLYRDVVLVNGSFDGLFRSYERGCHLDNGTMRAHQHTRTVRLYDQWVGYTACGVHGGDQPVWIGQSNLFEHATRLEISWDIYINQADEDQYYLYLNIARHIGGLLRDETLPPILQDLVVLMEPASLTSSDTTTLALDGWVKGCRPEVFTCVMGPITRIGFEPIHLPIPSAQVDWTRTRLVRFVIAKGSQHSPGISHEDIVEHIRLIQKARYTNRSKRASAPPRVEYHVQHAPKFQHEVTWRLESAKHDHALRWMNDHITFCELDEDTLGLGWSDLWTQAKGGKVVTVQKTAV